MKAVMNAAAQYPAWCRMIAGCPGLQADSAGMRCLFHATDAVRRATTIVATSNLQPFICIQTAKAVTPVIPNSGSTSTQRITSSCVVLCILLRSLYPEAARVTTCWQAEPLAQHNHARIR